MIVYIDELFQLSLEKKTVFEPDLTRSIDFDDPSMKKETISVKKSSRLLKMTKTTSIKRLFYICQHLSIHLGGIFQLTTIHFFKFIFFRLVIDND